MAEIEDQLLVLAATLTGLCSPAEAGARLDESSAVLMLVDMQAEDGSLCAGELLLAPIVQLFPTGISKHADGETPVRPVRLVPKACPTGAQGLSNWCPRPV